MYGYIQQSMKKLNIMRIYLVLYTNNDGKKKGESNVRVRSTINGEIILNGNTLGIVYQRRWEKNG